MCSFDPDFEDDGASFSVRRQRDLDRRYGKKKLLVAQEYFRFALSALSVPFALCMSGVVILIWYFVTGR